ncbi:MAG: DNA polymerase Y family protein [Acidimicrobiia bacterium]
MPVAVVGPNGLGDRGLVVQAASAEARREGVARGLRRREAEARCAELTVVDADDAADARAFETVVRAVEQLVPLLVLDRPGRCSFPTRGPSRYFGGDDALAQRVLEAVREVGVVDARVGIADGNLAAGLAARAADALVVPHGESAAFLAPWSVGVLAPHVDGGAELADLLARLGLRTLGAFAELPEPSILGRFGVPGVHALRLARGESTYESVPAGVPAELIETVEFDPPAERVDRAAFAAKGLADRLLGRLDELGLSCTRVVVEAETEHGEQLARCWRHDGSLTPATLVTRVRWQLEGWLTATGGITKLCLVPDEVVPATGRQLGFWGGDPAAGDHAARALARVQGMLGPESVVTAVPVGGRTPTERVRWVPWGEEWATEAAAPTAPWPGTVPGPSPARVFDPPLPADLVDADGQAITVSGRGEPSAAPADLRCVALPNGGGPLVAWAGPWPHDLRWWDRLRAGTGDRLRAGTGDGRRRRRALWQVVVDGGGDTAIACLVAVTRGRAEVEAIYD